MQKRLAVARARIDHDAHLRSDLERSLVNTATQHDAHTFSRLRSVPGLGKILSLVRLDEMHDLHRFPRVQACVSSGRLVKCAKESAGTRDGPSGTKIGNAYLQWAFSEAAVLCRREHPAGQKYLARLEQPHGQGQALTVLAQKWARAVYDMGKRDTAFDMRPFLPTEGSGVGEPVASLDHHGLSLCMARWNARLAASVKA